MRKCCYEVGDEFLGYLPMKPFVESQEGKLYLDPIGFAKEKLKLKGLRNENFFDVNICSYCSPENFFSYRKTKTPHRTLSFVVKQQGLKLFPPQERVIFREAVLDEILDERVSSSRSRFNPRGVKRKMSSYPLRPRMKMKTTSIFVEEFVRIIVK